MSRRARSPKDVELPDDRVENVSDLNDVVDNVHTPQKDEPSRKRKSGDIKTYGTSKKKKKQTYLNSLQGRSEPTSFQERRRNIASQASPVASSKSPSSNSRPSSKSTRNRGRRRGGKKNEAKSEALSRAQSNLHWGKRGCQDQTSKTKDVDPVSPETSPGERDSARAESPQRQQKGEWGRKDGRAAIAGSRSSPDELTFYPEMIILEEESGNIAYVAATCEKRPGGARVRDPRIELGAEMLTSFMEWSQSKNEPAKLPQVKVGFKNVDSVKITTPHGFVGLGRKVQGLEMLSIVLKAPVKNRLWRDKATYSISITKVCIVGSQDITQTLLHAMEPNNGRPEARHRRSQGRPSEDLLLSVPAFAKAIYVARGMQSANFVKKADLERFRRVKQLPARIRDDQGSPVPRASTDGAYSILKSKSSARSAQPRNGSPFVAPASSYSARSPRPWAAISPRTSGHDVVSLDDDDEGARAKRRFHHTRSMARSKAEFDFADADLQDVYFTYPLTTSEDKTNKDKISITKGDVKRTEEGIYLNDIIIDFYIRYLLLEKWNNNERMQESVYVYSSLFVKRMFDVSKREWRDARSGDKVKTNEALFDWTRRWGRKVDLFQKETLIFPINDALHWSVVVVLNAHQIPAHMKHSQKFEQNELFQDLVESQDLEKDSGSDAAEASAVQERRTRRSCPQPSSPTLDGRSGSAGRRNKNDSDDPFGAASRSKSKSLSRQGPRKERAEKKGLYRPADEKVLAQMHLCDSDSELEYDSDKQEKTLKKQREKKEKEKAKEKERRKDEIRQKNGDSTHERPRGAAGESRCKATSAVPVDAGEGTEDVAPHLSRRKRLRPSENDELSPLTKTEGGMRLLAAPTQSVTPLVATHAPEIPGDESGDPEIVDCAEGGGLYDGTAVSSSEEEENSGGPSRDSLTKLKGSTQPRGGSAALKSQLGDYANSIEAIVRGDRDDNDDGGAKARLSSSSSSSSVASGASKPARSRASSPVMPQWKAFAEYDPSKKPLVLFMDSLRSHRKTKVIKVILKYLQNLFSARARHTEGCEDDEAHIAALAMTFEQLSYEQLDVAAQSNSYDCGAFVVRYVEEVLNAKYATCPNGKDVSNEAVIKAVTSLLVKDFENVRSDMRNLIKSFHSKYEIMKESERAKKQNGDGSAEEHDDEDEVAIGDPDADEQAGGPAEDGGTSTNSSPAANPAKPASGSKTSVANESSHERDSEDCEAKDRSLEEGNPSSDDMLEDARKERGDRTGRKVSSPMGADNVGSCEAKSDQDRGCESESGTRNGGELSASAGAIDASRGNVAEGESRSVDTRTNGRKPQNSPDRKSGVRGSGDMAGANSDSEVRNSDKDRERRDPGEKRDVVSEQAQARASRRLGREKQKQEQEQEQDPEVVEIS